ncbi:phage tail protein [Beduini massiliensis]|uniref:phage tail protein n=1 Tax=Beduini massiliensis TaxID=1585974 RepID=UPI000693AA4D|nr:tail fiber protein [Beduini massiliensis]
MIVGKINQIGDILTTDNTNIANQYAENLQIQVEFDNKYDGYSWLWFCGYSYQQPKAVPILFDSTTSLITLPAEAFKHDGPLYVQAAVIKEGVKFTLEPVKFCIGQSLNQDFIQHGPTETEILQALIREIVKNEYDAPLQELITEAKQQQEIASEQQEIVSDLILIEQEYQKQEAIRVENENTRIENENQRKADEITRVESETNRVAKENERLASEAERIDSENTRNAKESERIGNERLREEKEVLRITKENERLASEAERIDSENTRKAKESERIENERLREEKEALRITKENERIANETVRIENESERQTISAEAVKNAQNATNNANTAAEEARSAVRDFSDTIISFEEFNQLENIQSGEQVKVLFGKIQQYFEYLLPTGGTIPFPGETAPNGYLLCQGQAVSRTTYSNLFNVIGTIYGSGDGSTTFNLPDLRGRVPVGKDDRDTDLKTLGNKGGEKAHTLTAQEMPSHNHSATLTINSGGAHTHTASSNSTGAHTHSVSGSAASAGTHYHDMDQSTFNKLDTKYGLTNSSPAYNDRVVGLNSSTSIGTRSAGAHTHSISGTAASAGGHSHTITVNSGGAHAHTGTVSITNTGGGQAHNNMQPYIVLNYIIKY